MSFIIIGTAGHVDHGKTELIKALTGKDTDRLKEEKTRGISIELGFAPFKLPDGRLVGVIDVPGHEKFIHNMLAGIGGIDLVLLVVDVTEGVMPQTREHVEIMDLLQIARGLVILTKTDLADDEEWLDLVEEEIREALSDTFLCEAPFFRVSAHTGRGLDDLVKAIGDATKELPSRDEKAPLRLPVDRVFNLPGFGTIVTGTVLAGTVQSGMNVSILPAGKTARVRQVQVHGTPTGQAVAGQRAAVNLSGLEKGLLSRGSVLAEPGSLEATYLLDAKLKLLASAPRKIKNMTRVHIYLGTGRAVGRIALLDRDELEPGGEAPVQLRLEKKLVAQNGDHFIIRSFSPMTTIGGGMVLDARPQKHKRFRKEVLEKLQELAKGDPSVLLLQRIRREAALTEKDLLKKSGLAPEVFSKLVDGLIGEGKVIRQEGLLVDAAAVDGWEQNLLTALAAFHRAQHLASGMSRAELKSALPGQLPGKLYDWLLGVLSAKGQLIVSEDLVALSSHIPEPTATETKKLGQLEAVYEKGGFKPPTAAEAAAEADLKRTEEGQFFAYLVQKGILVRLDGQYYLHRKYFLQAKRELCKHFRENKTLATGHFREKLGSTRKFVLPLLEKFDQLKWTRRIGADRVLWRLDLESCEGGEDIE